MNLKKPMAVRDKEESKKRKGLESPRASSQKILMVKKNGSGMKGGKKKGVKRGRTG